MIRFNCPHCNRPYELHPALAHLPLLCKQCGERITPPEASAEPPPPPAPPSPAPVKAKPAPVAEVVAPPLKVEPVAKAAAKPAAPPPPPEEDDEDDGVLVSKPDDSPDIDFNVGGPTAASLSDANRAKPAGLSDASNPRPPEPAPEDKPGAVNLDPLPPEPPRPAKRRAVKVAPKPAEPEPDAPTEKSGATLLPFLADLIALVVLLAGGMMLGEMLAQKPTGQVLSEAGSAPKFPPVELLLWAAPPAVLALLYLLLSGRQATLGAWVRRRTARA